MNRKNELFLQAIARLQPDGQIDLLLQNFSNL
jgi:hypothetical protein